MAPFPLPFPAQPLPTSAPPNPASFPWLGAALRDLRPHCHIPSGQGFPASCLSLGGPATSLSFEPGVVCVPARPASGCPGPLTLRVQSPSSSRPCGARVSHLTSPSHSLPLPLGHRRLQKHRQRPSSLASAPVQCPPGTAAESASERRPQCPAVLSAGHLPALWPVPSSHRPAAWPLSRGGRASRASSRRRPLPGLSRALLRARPTHAFPSSPGPAPTVTCPRTRAHRLPAGSTSRVTACASLPPPGRAQLGTRTSHTEDM